MIARRRLAQSILGTALAAALGTAALAQPAYPPGWQPPPPRQWEAPPPPPPGAAFIWVPGHWHWTGHRYFWVRGHYAHREVGWHHWVDGHWAVINYQWRWIPGHWR
ncbi:hypothetical protein [Acidocella sp.]|uniref:hypothetical protein n=1 Tax=Acidocella sp. TaxID=50710 RepID=UPI002619EA6D|nr:hypothetical protein [Acidocella sp.]